jgi:hypothetical protein
MDSLLEIKVRVIALHNATAEGGPTLFSILSIEYNNTEKKPLF